MAEFRHSRTPVPAGAVRVVLTRSNATLAYTCGGLRRDGNFGKPNAASYRRGAKLQPEAFASPAGCAAEIAVAQHLGLHWNARAWPQTQHRRFNRDPDVGENIEVKRIRDHKTHVEVKKKETNRNRILYVVRTIGEEHLEVDLLGWLTYDSAWDLATPTRGRDGTIDPQSRTLPLTALRPCTCLGERGGRHAPEPPVALGEPFWVPVDPLNGAGADNPACISNVSRHDVAALYTAANTTNHTYRTGGHLNVA